ncbi:glycosyltransferase [Paenibacillus alba]|uniref:Glycosyltransferase n=1 Tax=Paenibacillus alba TaxID=1197127 RepID=A0ABU6GHM6_9BACL|nr:glycosyltransferase [Paenibacillus alba]MEC0232692.1 glycosyltransferase [Paenibacillus alba]
MKTSIVIATYNKLEYTQQCIESIRNFTENDSYEIIVVDNNSTDSTVAWLSEQKDIQLIVNRENLGFPKACNQGIEIATGDNILLLNNDTIVTSNWLSNMIACLYSQEQIGAVGPVTNNISYYQKIATNYATLDEMHGFAAMFNISDPRKWEECLHLVGFCLLIKSSLVNEIGLLDERFTPGNYEDDDYSLRIRLAGYKLTLCRDTFIHHYGSASFKDNEAKSKYEQLLTTNREKFIDKWNFNSDLSHVIREDLIDLIDEENEAPIKILDIGCLCGGTLLRIKHLFPFAELHGVESNSMCVQVASHFANVVDSEHQFEQGYFDYILLSDSTLERPEQLLEQYKRFLKQEGQWITSIPNSLHYRVVNDFIRGMVRKEEKQYLNLSEIDAIYKEAGFGQLSITGVTSSEITASEREFINKLIDLSQFSSSAAYEIKNFLIKATAKEPVNDILDSLNQLNDENGSDHAIQKLLTFEDADIIDSILKMKDKQIEIFNQLAVMNFEKGHHEHVLPYLLQAYECNAKDESTLYNMGYILYRYGENESALDYLLQILEKDDEIIELIQQIQSNIDESQPVNQDEVLKLLLRRIEFHIDQDEAIQTFIEIVRDEHIQVEAILEIVDREIIQKSEILNLLGCVFSEYELYEMVIPLFNQSLVYNPVNEAALHNLGMFLFQLGEYESALNFLESITDKNEVALETIVALRKDLSDE